MSILNVQDFPTDPLAGTTLPPASASANQVYAGPTSGGAVAPTFRGLVAGDIPNIAESQVTNLVSDLGTKAPLASPVLTGNPQSPVLWLPVAIPANLVAPTDTRAHFPDVLSVPAGLLVDLSASTRYTLLEIW